MRMSVPDDQRSKLEIMVNPRLMTHLGVVFEVGSYNHPGKYLFFNKKN